MTSRDLAAALFAVLGIYFLGELIPETGLIVFEIFDPDAFLQRPHWVQGLLLAAISILQLALGASLILLRNRIAMRLFPDTPSAGTPIGLTDLQAAAFAVVGAYFVVNSLAAMAYGFARLPVDEGIGALWPRSAGHIARGVLGMALFLGARGTAGAWSLARQAGQR